MPDEPTESGKRGNRSRFRNQDGVTSEQRDTAPAQSAVLGAEQTARRQHPAQLDLFTESDRGTWTELPGGLPPLTASSSLDLARTEYRRHLEAARRPINTIESYSYDLAILESLIGPRPINRIERQDIARFLADTTSKTTRKRRLTSVRRFFRYLIDDLHILRFDPTEGYYPHQISLRTPIPLFSWEQEALLDAAETDEIWSSLAIQLMMHLGLTRAELLTLERDHIDRTNEDSPIVYVVYEELARQSKDRRLRGTQRLATTLQAYLDESGTTGRLIPVGPPAVNGMVERVRREAGISRDVTPQTLRTTFAVEQAKAGVDQQGLIALLGLANDPRNRASVDRYITLAAEPTNHPPGGLKDSEQPR